MSSTQARSKRRRSGTDGAFCGGGKGETGKRSLYHCNYCQRNISDSVRIKCAICMDFDLCVECFSVGVELGEHKNTHSYRVMDFLAFPLHHPAWGADEELLLLEGIDMYGIGNWQAVSEHVGEKSPEACKKHYYQIYIESPAAPLPTAVPELQGVEIAELTRRQLSQGTPPAIRPAAEEPPTKAPATAGAAAAAPASQAASAEAAAAAPTPVEGVKVKAEPQQAKAPAPTPSVTPPLVSRGRRRGARASTAAATAATDAAIAMIPGAITSVAAADTGGGKGGSGKAGGAGASGGAAAAAGGGAAASGSGRQPNAKVETSGYMRFRDEFDPDYDGDAEHPIANLDFLETDTPELVSAKVRMLQIYNERLDERERRREVIKQMGYTDVRKLQAAEKKKTPYERRLGSALRVFEHYQTPEEADALGSGLLQEAQLRARIATLQQLRRLGARTFAAGEAIQADLKRREQIAAGRAGGRAGRQQGAAADSTTSGGGAVAQIPPSVAATLGPPLGLPRTAAVQVAQWKGRRGSPLDISQMPGVNSLIEKERELCTAHRLLPGHWLLLKETMMREDARRGGTLTRSIARNLFRLEPARATRLFDLAVSQGWVSRMGTGKATGAVGTSGTAPSGVKAIEAGPSSAAGGTAAGVEKDVPGTSGAE